MRQRIMSVCPVIRAGRSHGDGLRFWAFRFIFPALCACRARDDVSCDA